MDAAHGDLPLSLLRGVKQTSRGPMLVMERGATVWLARGGDNPRGWKAGTRSRKQGGPVRWKHARPDVDEFLRPARIYGESFEIIKRQLPPSLESLGEMPERRSAAWWEWHHARCEIIRRALGQAVRLRAMATWASSFSQEALEFVERHRFTKRKWHLLNLYLRVPEGRELFEQCPQLAFALASSWCLKSKPVARPLRSIRSLVRKPRSRILTWLDLPPGKGVLRLLSRIPADSMDGKTLFRLRRVLPHAKYRGWLANLKIPTICPEVLGILAFGQPVSFPILECIAGSELIAAAPDSLPVTKVHADILRMGRMLQLDPSGELSRIESKDRLWHLHERLVRAMPLRGPGEEMEKRWPAPIEPPLPPAPFMTPLRELEDLLDEAGHMEHCVASWAGLIVSGRYYVYGISYSGTRATLGVARDQRGAWHLAELRGIRNATVPADLLSIVQTWLHDARAAQAADEDESDWLPF